MLALLAYVSLSMPAAPAVDADEGWRKKIYRFIRERIVSIPDDDKREIVKLGLSFFNSLPEDSRNDIAKSMQGEILKLFAPKKKDK